jgi:hypothetical protein
MLDLLSSTFCSAYRCAPNTNRPSANDEVVTPQNSANSIFYNSPADSASGSSTRNDIYLQLSELPISPASTSSQTLMEHIKQNSNPDHIKVIIDNIQWYALACHYCDGQGQLPDDLSNIQVNTHVNANEFPNFKSAKDLLESEDYTTLTLCFKFTDKPADPTKKIPVKHISHKMYLEYLFSKKPAPQIQSQQNPISVLNPHLCL